MFCFLFCKLERHRKIKKKLFGNNLESLLLVLVWVYFCTGHPKYLHSQGSFPCILLAFFFFFF